MVELAFRPHLQPKVHSLEIRSSSMSRTKGNNELPTLHEHIPLEWPPPALNPDSIEQCQNVVQHDATWKIDEQIWSNHLSTEVLPALMRALLCILLSLKSSNSAALG
jgi:hypothetical protein